MGEIDIYCERLGPGLWAEPVNALTNAAFFVAAWLVWRAARRAHAVTPWIGLLLGLVVAIGIGSSLFHTFATPWARVLDELPILLFQLVFLWLYARRVANMRALAAVGGIAAFLLAALYARRFPQLMNGSLVYAPAVVAVCVLGIYHAAHRHVTRMHLALAAGLLLLAVCLRSVDAAVCEHFALGTHFLWHLLVAAVIYLCASVVVGLPPKHVRDGS